jgi:hypothetical protein
VDNHGAYRPVTIRHLRFLRHAPNCRVRRGGGSQIVGLDIFAGTTGLPMPAPQASGARRGTSLRHGSHSSAHMPADASLGGPIATARLRPYDRECRASPWRFAGAGRPLLSALALTNQYAPRPANTAVNIMTYFSQVEVEEPDGSVHKFHVVWVEEPHISSRTGEHDCSLWRPIRVTDADPGERHRHSKADCR